MIRGIPTARTGTTTIRIRSLVTPALVTWLVLVKGAGAEEVSNHLNMIMTITDTPVFSICIAGSLNLRFIFRAICLSNKGFSVHWFFLF